MIEKYINRTDFSSYEDFMQNYELHIPDHFNFGYDIVDEWARIQPEKTALIWTNTDGDERFVTYKELQEQSDRVAAFLLDLGIQKGDRVMTVLKKRIEWWFIIIAMHKIGAIIIPSSYQLTGHDISYRRDAAGVRAIITCDDPLIMHHVDNACTSATDHINTLKICAFQDGHSREGWIDFWSGVEAAPEFHRPEWEITNEDSMLMYFTSGTEGMPKMVVHDFKYPLCHIVTGRFWMNLDETSVHLTMTDTGWAMAIWGLLYPQMLCGATVVIYDQEGRFEPRQLLEVLQRYHVTSTFAPPTVYRFLVHEDMSSYDLTSLRYSCVAGEALYPALFERWHQLTGIWLKECFGQTETPIAVGTYIWCESRPGSMGLPGPQVHMDIVDDEGNPCPPHKNGHLVVQFAAEGNRPLGLLKEYYRNPELTDKKLGGAYYDTGDMVYKDEDGYYWYVSRSDDVIKSSGYRIGPFEVESILMKHPAVSECAITGVPDDIRGQLVKATVVLTPDYQGRADEALIKDLQTYVKENTAPYKYPRVVEFVPSLPKTVTGKIRRVEIRNRDFEK